MTIHELYDLSIKPLSVEDRLRLARIILDDAAPDDPEMTLSESQQRFEQLIQEGLDSPAIPLTEHVWDHIRDEVRARSAGRDQRHA